MCTEERNRKGLGDGLKDWNAQALQAGAPGLSPRATMSPSKARNKKGAGHDTLSNRRCGCKANIKRKGKESSWGGAAILSQVEIQL